MHLLPLWPNNLQHHDEVHDDHETLTIDEYRRQAGRLETRMCTEHKEHPYILGCGVCLSVFCSKCISPANTCKMGKLI